MVLVLVRPTLKQTKGRNPNYSTRCPLRSGPAAPWLVRYISNLSANARPGPKKAAAKTAAASFVPDVSSSSAVPASGASSSSGVEGGGVAPAVAPDAPSGGVDDGASDAPSWVDPEAIGDAAPESSFKFSAAELEALRDKWDIPAIAESGFYTKARGGNWLGETKGKNSSAYGHAAETNVAY